jgi:hypothetical protein
MTMSAAVRTAAATAAWAASATLAVASEAAVEGQGDLQGAAALVYLLGGVAAMGLVIWLMLKFMNRKG